MILQILLGFSLLMNIYSDTLLLPLRNGKVKDNSISKEIFHERLEAIIYPTNSLVVRSCSDGIVLNIFRSDGRYEIIIKSDSLAFTYILDAVSIKCGKYIKKGEEIGKLNPNSSDGAYKENSLIFIVTKNDRILDAKKFLVFK